MEKSQRRQILPERFRPLEGEQSGDPPLAVDPLNVGTGQRELDLLAAGINLLIRRVDELHRPTQRSLGEIGRIDVDGADDQSDTTGSQARQPLAAERALTSLEASLQQAQREIAVQIGKANLARQLGISFSESQQHIRGVPVTWAMRS